MTDRVILVCAKCLRASCWHGECLCDEAQNADIKPMRESELRALNREHPSNYSQAKLDAIYGIVPRLIDASR